MPGGTARAGSADLPDELSEIFFAGGLDSFLVICPAGIFCTLASPGRDPGILFEAWRRARRRERRTCQRSRFLSVSDPRKLSPFIRVSRTRVEDRARSEKCQEGHSAKALLYISEPMATQIAPAGGLPPEVASPQRSAAGRPSRRSHCPGGPCSTSFTSDVESTGPGIQ